MTGYEIVQVIFFSSRTGYIFSSGITTGCQTCNFNIIDYDPPRTRTELLVVVPVGTHIINDLTHWWYISVTKMSHTSLLINFLSGLSVIKCVLSPPPVFPPKRLNNFDRF